MKHQRAIHSIILSTFILLVGSVHFSFAEDNLTGKRHTKAIDLGGVGVEKRLSAILVGSGIEGIVPASLAVTDSGGSIHWAKTRERVDDLGMRHVFYRQHYTPPIGPVTAKSPAARAGVWLVGAELGLHYDAEGLLMFVFGTQHENVLSTTMPTVGTSSDAYSVAQSQAGDYPGFSAAVLGEVSPRFAASDLSKARLLLLSEDPGSFRYSWKIPVRASSGSVHIANMDAATGSITSLRDTATWSACGPDSYEPYDQDAAEGEAQNSAIDERDIWATELDSPGTYTHEAHKIGTSSIPDIQVFYGTTGADACHQNNDQYALVQVETVGGTPTYPDEVDGIGKSATDAIFFTERTMNSFDDWGRDGWDDNGGDAVVVVDSYCWNGTVNEATFNYAHDVDWTPHPALSVCKMTTGGAYGFTFAAALDVIAHEWGHGVVYTGPNWDREDEDEEDAKEASILHEAWADVIGHAVEWDNQTSGTGYEKADWMFHEDVYSSFGSYSRRADEDDGDTQGEEGFKYHEADTPGDDDNFYHHGHPLSVAFYLMADGAATNHKNPWCETDSNNEDCTVTVDDIGVAFASQILFDVLTSWATSSHGMTHFANLARSAAYSRFRNCPLYNGSDEQQAAIDAFTAIGYPPTTSSPIVCK